MPGIIADIQPGSPAAKLGMRPGDQILAINGSPLLDVIDYQYHSAASHLTVDWQDQNGQQHRDHLLKRPEREFGVTFSANLFDGMRECCNHCLFCFVNQLPQGCRSSLYIKDDDYRMSFMLGNYITGTNLTPQDIKRIKELRLSPLYISVHATEDSLRKKLLGNVHAQPIMPFLEELTAAGIEIHSQLVLCPGINDGEHLERSLQDLLGLYPGIASIALVPVGLTKHKNPHLRPYTKEEAQQVLQIAEQYQSLAQKQTGGNVLFAADEFFLLAEAPIPPADYYEDFCQLENGVGLVRTLWDDWEIEKSRLPQGLEQPCAIGLVTGVSGEQALAPIVKQLNQIPNLTVESLPIPNRYFGETVTVTGLVTGSAICQELQAWRQRQPHSPKLLLPDVMLRYEEDLFLDDMTPQQLQQLLQIELLITPNSAAGLVDGILKWIERGK